LLVPRVKAKAVLQQTDGGAGGRGSYSFSTLALDGGEWSASRPGCALAPGKEPPVPIVQEAGRAPELVWTQRLGEKSFAAAEDRTPVVQSVVRYYTELPRFLVPRVQYRNNEISTQKNDITLQF
jgi:hypothetical protein